MNCASYGWIKPFFLDKDVDWLEEGHPDNTDTHPFPFNSFKSTILAQEYERFLFRDLNIFVISAAFGFGAFLFPLSNLVDLGVYEAPIYAVCGLNAVNAIVCLIVFFGFDLTARTAHVYHCLTISGAIGVALVGGCDRLFISGCLDTTDYRAFFFGPFQWTEETIDRYCYDTILASSLFGLIHALTSLRWQPFHALLFTVFATFVYYITYWPIPGCFG